MTYSEDSRIMHIANYRDKALKLIDAYLDGKASRDSVWEWAQEVIVSKEWGHLPTDIQDAIHGLWLLHDNRASWVPSIEEIRRIRNELAK